VVAALLVAAAAAPASCGSARRRAAAAPNYPRVSVVVGSRPVSRPLAPGFVGFSFEYAAVPAYSKPVIVQLIRDLSPGQRPVLRIGGNSTDETWWPSPGESRPRGARYPLSARWLAAIKALASASDAKLILGLNLAGESVTAASDEARVLLRGIGSGYIEAFEIGNEPDLYGLFPWPHQRSLYRRPPGYNLTDYIREFSRWRAAIGGRLPVTGPAYATFDWPLQAFIDAEPRLTQVTFHHYPLDACLTKPSARGYPKIASLLSDQSSAGLARQLAASVATAHAHRLPFRLDELNSASCGGKRGVSDSFASAPWMLDTLFNLARVGVDGVNVHTFPGAAYAPFSASGHLAPEYYGMLMFAHAFPPGARLLRTAVTPSGPLKAWATIGAGRRMRIVLINKSTHRTYQVRLRAPGLSGSLRVERLRGGFGEASADSIVVPAQTAVLISPAH
jgi:hypothetical protein